MTRPRSSGLLKGLRSERAHKILSKNVPKKCILLIQKEKAAFRKAANHLNRNMRRNFQSHSKRDGGGEEDSVSVADRGSLGYGNSRASGTSSSRTKSGSVSDSSIGRISTTSAKTTSSPYASMRTSFNGNPPRASTTAWIYPLLAERCRMRSSSSKRNIFFPLISIEPERQALPRWEAKSARSVSNPLPVACISVLPGDQ